MSDVLITVDLYCYGRKILIIQFIFSVSVAQRKKGYLGLIRGGISFHFFKVCFEKLGNVFVSSLLLVPLN